ncbi:MAG: elongation factor 1-beta [Nitrososphaeria archaeon]
MPNKVLVRIKILPNDIETKPEDIINSIKNFKVVRYTVEPIAFGLNAIIADIEMDEAEGGTDPLEEELKNNPLVSEVEVIAVSYARTKL